MKAQNILVGIVLVMVLSSGLAYGYNKSWDQGHQCTQHGATDGSWGKYDSDGTRHGNYSSKECCQLYCKVCPVYANTGRLQQTFTDLTVPGEGPSLSIGRTYQSQEWATSLFGRGWLFNFGRKLTFVRTKEGDKQVIVRRSAGEINFFKEDTDGTLESLADYGVSYELTKQSDGTYVIAGKDGSLEHINSDGKLLSIIDKNANQMQFEYNAVGCISRITNASGNYIDFQLGPNGKIATISDNLGRSVNYTYDTNGNLISASDPMGNVTQYTYDSENRLASIIDPLGNTVFAVTYDSSQPPRIATMMEKGETWTIAYYTGYTIKTDSSGNAWTYYFNELGIIERVVDPLGNETKQSHNKVTSTSMEWEDDALGNRTSYTYDADGNRASKTDPLGNTWQYTYVTGTDRIETETNPLGVVTKYEYDTNGNLSKLIRDFGGALENTTSYSYDASGNQTSTTDPLGNQTQYEYDSDGNLAKVTDALGSATTYAYDTRGNRLTETDALGNTATYTYDLLDHLLTVTDALGNTTTYAYDGNGNRTTETDANGNATQYVYDAYNRLVQVIDALGNIASYTYDYRDNRTSMTDGNGNTTTYAHDVLNRMTSETNASGGVTAYTYDAVGNILTNTDALGNVTTSTYDVMNRRITSTNALGETTQYAYNALGNLTHTTYPNGNVLSKTFDRLGRTLSISDTIGTIATYVYDSAGRIVQQADAQGSTTSLSYDGIGRLIGRTDALGNSTLYNYDAVGNALSVVDREGQTTTKTFDALGRCIAQADALGNSNQFVFDNVGNMLQMIDPRGNATSFEYDALGRRIKKTYPDGSYVSWTYDNVGNSITKTNESGQVTQYTYDTLNRKTRDFWPASGKASDFTYDSAGNMLSAVNASSTVSFTYDAIGRLSSCTQDGAVITYNYDMTNGTTTITYPNGKQVQETRDNRSVLTQVADLGSALLVSYSHDNMGRVLSVDYPNGLSFGTARDGLGRITDVVQSNGASQIVNYHYTRDKVGHKLSRGDGIDSNESEEYRYDAGYRITERREGQLVAGSVATPTSSEVFNYDSGGNIVTYTMDGVVENRIYNAMNQISSINGTALAYDAQGNLLDDNKNTYVYDEGNQLIQVTRKSDGQVLVDFAYDALNRRVSKTSHIPSVKQTRFVYDGLSFRLLAETATDGTLEKVNVWGADLSGTKDGAGGVGGLLTMEDLGSSTILGHGYDDLGNVIMLYDLTSSNSTLGQYRYSAFGEVLESTGANADSSVYRFSTKYMDFETGLLYYGRRYYDSSAQRWITRDPLYGSSMGAALTSTTGEFNIYAFVKNNSLNKLDYNGLVTWQEAKDDFCSYCNNWATGTRTACFIACSLRRDEIFSTWLDMERRDTSWFTSIPKCPRNICIDNGNAINPDTSKWENPNNRWRNQFFHPGASWEMRSREFSGHGNQCTYDSNGEILTQPPAAGSADFAHYSNLGDHTAHDVQPYSILWGWFRGRRDEYYSVRPVLVE